MSLNTSQSPESVEQAPEKYLTPAEFAREIEQICAPLLKLQQEHKVGLVLPPEFIAGQDENGNDINDGAKSILGVLSGLGKQAQTDWEPPEMRKNEEKIPVVTADTNMPQWLRELEGHQQLIWKGASDNPLWKLNLRQIPNATHPARPLVQIDYQRRHLLLKPGRGKDQQSLSLKPLRDTFSLEESQVLEAVMAEYYALEKQYENQEPADIQAQARTKFQAILREENKFKINGEKSPTGIQEQLISIIDTVSKRVRGSKKKEELEALKNDDFCQDMANILSQLFALNRYHRKNGKDKIPAKKGNIKEIPSFALNLQNIAQSFINQLENKMGTTLVIGEPGTGKNEAIERIAATTGRKLFVFSCGKGMDAQDLFYRDEYNPQEGTRRVSTELLEGIHTPGAIVLVDELTSLPAHVQAAFHSLGDARRAIQIGNEIHQLAEDVVVVYCVNPATSGAAGNMGDALLSRCAGNTVNFEYPALSKGDLLSRRQAWNKREQETEEQDENELQEMAYDEIAILYPKLAEFAELKDEEFALLWESIITEGSDPSLITLIQADDTLKKLFENSASQKTIIDLRDILKIADSWRKNFVAKTKFDLVGISIRETLAVVTAYAKSRDVRAAYVSVFQHFKRNPIDGLDSHFLSLENLIDQVLSENVGGVS